MYEKEGNYLQTEIGTNENGSFWSEAMAKDCLAINTIKWDTTLNTIEYYRCKGSVILFSSVVCY